MKFTKEVEVEYDVKYLLANVAPRYWEDAKVCGIEDDGSLMPCRKGDVWEIKINLETGNIENWEIGKTAEVHYKVCDAGHYYLLDKDDSVIFESEGYVPEILAIEDDGFGDYIIIDIDENGNIENWDNSESKLAEMMEYLRDNNN